MSIRVFSWTSPGFVVDLKDHLYSFEDAYEIWDFLEREFSFSEIDKIDAPTDLIFSATCGENQVQFLYAHPDEAELLIIGRSARDAAFSFAEALAKKFATRIEDRTDLSRAASLLTAGSEKGKLRLRRIIRVLVVLIALGFLAFYAFEYL